MLYIYIYISHFSCDELESQKSDTIVSDIWTGD